MLKDKDSKQSIQVTIRVRPLSQKQLNEDPRICVKLQQNHSLHLGVGSEVKKFTFDSICFNQSQQSMYERVGKKCAVDCLEGYNCTVFAYGQTGAGKTYTMMGISFENENYYENRGLVPRTLQFLFECIERERENGVNFIIRCSFLQIYNEQIIDLLNKNNTNLQLRQDTRKGVYVQGITEQIISKSEDAMQILYKGSKSRHVGSTFYNQTSSRSHSVFTMQIQSKYTKNGVSNTKSRQFNFIDLAGSQRTKQSTGQRLKEGCNINKSLMNLASVINALSEVSQGKTQHVNYRNSKLTFLLKDSLGGNSKTNLIANISPAQVFYQQTLSTLMFARRAKLIKREKACINQDSSGNLESLKNEIKRLKQQVITLMSRAPSNGQDNNSGKQQPSQMTAIMHQYVEEQIDKQTKLELEILKLNERIIYLQNGIKQFSNNQIHLRLILSIYEDKVSRLKGIQKMIAGNIDGIQQNQQLAVAIVDYFRHQRNGFIKQLQNTRAQQESGKFMKEILKQAKIVKDQGQDDSLRELLTRNTTFLTQIRAKLDQMRPETVASACSEQYEGKMKVMGEQFAKKEEQYHQRLQQINLQLSQFKSRSQQNEKLLEEAISGHIVFQEKLKEQQQKCKKIENELTTSKQAYSKLNNQYTLSKKQSQQAMIDLKNELNDKGSLINSLKKEIDTFKVKIQKMSINQTALKEQFQNLQEEKYKIDKQLMQSIEELRQAKNSLLKSESQIGMLNNKIQSFNSQSEYLNSQITKLQEQIIEKQKNLRNKLEESQKQHSIEIEKKLSQCSQLLQKLSLQQQKTKILKAQLSEQKQQFEQAINQFKKTEQQYKSDLLNKQQKIKQLISLINQKEMNGTQTAGQLNQLKLEIINAHSQKETTEAKYKKMVEELKQKIQKQLLTIQSLQTQTHQSSKLYDTINSQYLMKKKENSQLLDSNLKLTSKCTYFEEELKFVEQKNEQLTKQLDSIKNREKEQKLLIIEMKNQLFVAQKNSQIQLDALKSQICLKDQQIQQLEKDSHKNKIKMEKHIEQLTNQLNISTETFKNQEESLKKSMQSHLISKEKKLTQMKQLFSQKEESINRMSMTIQELQEKIENLISKKSQLQEKITVLELQKQNIQQQYDQNKQDYNKSVQKYQKNIEDIEITHCEQIDQKNQQIQVFMLENQTLTKQIEQSKQALQALQKQKQGLYEDVSKKTLQITNINTENNSLKEELASFKQNFQNLRNQVDNQLLQKSEQTQKKINNMIKNNEDLSKKISDLNQKFLIKYSESEALFKKNETLEDSIRKLNSQISTYINTISMLNQQNCNLNKQISEFYLQIKQKQDAFLSMQSTHLAQQSQIKEQIVKLSAQIEEYQNKIEYAQLEHQNNQLKISKLEQTKAQFQINVIELKQSINHISEECKNLSKQRQDLIASLQVKNKEYLYVCEQLESSNQNIAQLEQQMLKIQQEKARSDLTLKEQQQLNQGLNWECSQLKQQLADAQVKIKNISIQLSEQKQQLLKSQQQINILADKNNSIIEEVSKKERLLDDLTIENTNIKDKISKYESHVQKLGKQLQEIHTYKQKYQLQLNQMDQMKSTIEDEKASKERIYHEMCKEKQMCSNLKMLLQNKSAQNMQLEIQLEQKISMYNKLVEKIAKNESQNKKTTNSEHYLKTIQLLQKSRAEQIELRRQNEQLKKVMMTMKETIEQKESYVRQVEQKSEGYCVSMHKRNQQIQKDYVELERNFQRVVKEKKSLEKAIQQYDQQKEQIKNLKVNASKIAQKNEELQNKIKKANLDYIQLEKQYEQIKRNQLILPNTDDKTTYINRLKAEVAALKTQKVLLTDTLNKQREEKTKLKAQMRFGKDGNGEISMKVQLEKKINENKNLTELIFQIISQLKICVNEPKAKLQVIRSIILGAIKQKNTQIKGLKQKIKECQAQHYRQVPSKPDYIPYRENRQLKALSISNANRNIPNDESHYKYQKDKDISYLNNNSRQKMKQFEKYYAKFKYNEEDGKTKARQ